MKGIITVYRSDNCGSFLQAFALQEYVIKNGFDAAMVRYRTSFKLSPLTNELKHIIASFVKLRFRTCFLNIKRLINFHKARDSVFHKTIRIEEADYLIIGSDTLWNVKDFYFKAKINYYTGVTFPPSVRFSTFSTSIGQSSLDDLSNYRNSIANLVNADVLSVRDANSYAAVSNIIGREPYITCDPTLLLLPNEYRKAFGNDVFNPTSPYILVYSFDNIDDSFVKKIREYANAHDLKIVCFDSYKKWADDYIVSSPRSFIKAFDNASFVVTDTFHGCIFSIIFNKEFITINRKKNKVFDLLDHFSLLDRCCSTEKDVEKAMSNKIDYRFTNGIIEKDRLFSMNVLKEIFTYDKTCKSDF